MKRITLTYFVLFCCVIRVFANNPADSIKKVLTFAGYENIAIQSVNNSIILTFENRLFRFTPSAINNVQELIKPFTQNYTTIYLIPQYKKTPILTITIEKEKTINVTPVIDSIWNYVKKVQIEATSLRKLDIVISPQYHVSLGDYDNPIKWQLNIAPDFQLSLWKGMTVSAQVGFPLYNEFEEKGNEIRPGIVSFNQIVRLPKNIYLSATIGYFPDYNRYGINIEAMKYIASNVFIGGTWGRTGQAKYSNGILDYWMLEVFDYRAYIDYRNARLNTNLRLTLGKFLYSDYGFRFDMNRQFKEINIGFFVLKSELGTNGGFNFSIPIPPSKYFKPKRMRISPLSYFRWEYRANMNVPEATIYENGSELNNFMRFYQPQFIKSKIKGY